LRRVDPAMLTAHLAEVAGRGGVAVAPGALRLLARAADGSVRDGLSLLDTAIAHGAEAGRADATVTEAEVQDMLGLADRGRVVDLFDQLIKGEAAAALEGLDAFYAAGADPGAVLQDLLELCHFLTRLKVVPGLADGAEVGDAERARAREMADALSVPTLARAWQMLLKGLGEVQAAPSPIAAAAMVLVRLAYAAELPAPAELVRRLEEGEPEAEPAPQGGGAPEPGRHGAGVTARGRAAAPLRRSARQTGESSAERPSEPRGAGGGGPALARDTAPSAAEAREAADEEAEPETAETAPERAEPETGESAGPASFADLVALFARHREAILHAHLVADVHPVRFEPGRIEFRPGPHAPANLANRMGELLHRWTGRRWVVSVSKAEGAPTLKQQGEAAEAAARRAAAADPLVRAVLEAFPGATIEAVRERGACESPDLESTNGDENP
ncbi:MAG: DNA polymerase III subunit gamma/tau, partial [Planctomycetota bacterium]